MHIQTIDALALGKNQPAARVQLLAIQVHAKILAGLGDLQVAQVGDPKLAIGSPLQAGGQTLLPQVGDIGAWPELHSLRAQLLRFDTVGTQPYHHRIALFIDHHRWQRTILHADQHIPVPQAVALRIQLLR